MWLYLEVRFLTRSSNFANASPGRTLAQCRDMYREYIARAPAHPPPARSAQTFGPHPQSNTGFLNMQHAYPTELRSPLQIPATRYPEIQPRPPNYAGPASLAVSPSFEPPRKKRGRPSKAELEQRRDAARSRGELSPNRRRELLPAVHVPHNVSVAAQAAQAVMAAPSQYSNRPSTPYGTLPINRKRPFYLDIPDNTRPSSTVSDDERARQIPHPSQQPQQPHAPLNRPPQRDYPQILSQDPTGSQPTFKAPRGE